MPMFADVSLPVAVDKTFTYLIPPELSAAAKVGTRVIVPFGRRYATGVIVGLPAGSSVASLRPLKDVLDSAPVVSDELLRLCRWLASYYFAPLGEVLKAAIPHGFTTSHKRLVHPTAQLAGLALPDQEKHPPARTKLLAVIKQTAHLLSTDLQKRTGIRNVNAILNDLQREGLVVLEEVVPGPAAKPRMRECIPLQSLDDTLLAAASASLPARRKKARELLASLQLLKSEGRDEVSLPELLKRTGASLRAVKELAEKGVLRIARREVTRQQEFGTEEQTLRIVLNDVQRGVVGQIADAIDAGAHRTFLLHGVTGSGKTQVYIEALRQCLERGKSAIVLVPEISLTPQIVRRFKSHFGGAVAVVHSRMSAGERHDVWRLALRGEYRVVIGPRSAVFAPLEKLGLIVVDEEHEASYKQFDSTPRYNARDAAIVRASLCGAVAVLGSATPSVESYHNAGEGKYTLLEMPQRIQEVTMPAITIVDMTAERKRNYAALKESLPPESRMKLKEFHQPSISALLEEKIGDRLSRKEGIILLQNRRGFAPFVECTDCGYAETCDRCNVTLTYHLAKRHLRCHYCGLIRPPLAQCPQCLGFNIRLQGVGTQRVEQELAALFPQARVARMDLDTTSRKGAHERILTRFGDGEADILLGTQMVAKGLDFARVTLVGVISADTQMLLPDFRSSERTFQILTQVAGRAGRSTLHGEVIIQTRQPAHRSLAHVVDHDFTRFFEEELQTRKELDYPPFSRIVLVETKGPEEEDVRKEAERFRRLIKDDSAAFTVLGPSPAVIGKIKDQFRWHLVVKSLKSGDPAGSIIRESLHHAVTAFERGRKGNIRLIVDVDPVGMM